MRLLRRLLRRLRDRLTGQAAADELQAKLEAAYPVLRPGGLSGHGCPKCGSKNWVPSPVWMSPFDPITGHALTGERLQRAEAAAKRNGTVAGQRCHPDFDHQCVSCGHLFNLPGIPWGFDNLHGQIIPKT